MASENFPLPQPQFVFRTRVIVTAAVVFCGVSENFPLAQPQFASRMRVIVLASTVYCVASPFLRQPAEYFARVVVRITRACAAHPAPAVDLLREPPFIT